MLRRALVWITPRPVKDYVRQTAKLVIGPIEVNMNDAMSRQDQMLWLFDQRLTRALAESQTAVLNVNEKIERLEARVKAVEAKLFRVEGASLSGGPAGGQRAESSQA